MYVMRKGLYFIYILISLFVCISCGVQRNTYLYKNTNTPELVIDSIAKAEHFTTSDYKDWHWQVLAITNDSLYTKQYMRVLDGDKYLHIISVIVNPNDTIIKYKKEKK